MEIAHFSPLFAYFEDISYIILNIFLKRTRSGHKKLCIIYDA